MTATYLSQEAIPSEMGTASDSNWPSRFLVNGKIPDQVAGVEIDSVIGSVIGVNQAANSVSEYERGLSMLEKMHLRMTAARAKEAFMMKLTYFLIKQYGFVISKQGAAGEGAREAMVNHFLTLEAFAHREPAIAGKIVPQFHKGISALRNKVKSLALDVYRKRKLEVASNQHHEGYAQDLGNSTTRVRGASGQCGNWNYSRSDCYECASYAVERALKLRFGQSDPWGNPNTNRRLNYPQYANQFHKGWVEDVDRRTFRLTQVFQAKDHSSSEKVKGLNTALAAPNGSVLVWNVCGSHPAGHIAVKTSATQAASSFTAPIQKTCSNPRTQIIGVYAPVENTAKVQAFRYDEKRLQTQLGKTAVGQQNPGAGESDLSKILTEITSSRRLADYSPGHVSGEEIDFSIESGEANGEMRLFEGVEIQ